jgi:hypothetical protein
MNNGRSFKSILNSFLSVRRMAMTIGSVAIENLRKSSVAESIPFWVRVLTKTPPDPNIIPARIGKIK